MGLNRYRKSSLDRMYFKFETSLMKKVQFYTTGRDAGNRPSIDLNLITLPWYLLTLGIFGGRSLIFLYAHPASTVIFSDEDWGCPSSPPKRMIFRFQQTILSFRDWMPRIID